MSNKKIDHATIAFSTGLRALIFSTQFFDIPKNICVALILAILGIIGMLYGAMNWKK